MVKSTDPRQKSFQTQTVATVWARTELPLVSVPIVVIFDVFVGETFSLVSLEQGIVVPNTHAATNDLSDSWSEHVYRLGQSLVVLSSRHVEGFYFCWERMEENVFADGVGHVSFRRFWDVFAEFIHRGRNKW